MKSFKIVINLAFSVLLTSAIFAQNSKQVEQLDFMIKQGIKDWQVPGLAALVVKDGQVVFKKTYGVKNLETKEAVDEHTLFNMASTTKAIVALSIGMLVDEGKLDWEDKVIDHLPRFKLSDPYITADARVKDLLTHNLGIGNADELWVLDSVSANETVHRLQYAKRTYPLRGGFVYQNIMYAAAGELIEAVSGQHWADFVKNRVFIPLEMNRSQTRSIDILKVGNYTTPYLNHYDDGIVKVAYTFSDQIGAAGMIWSSQHDIANYLTFLVNDGVYKKDTLIKPKTFKYLFEPQTLLYEGGTYPTNGLTKPNWNTYGLGWFQQDYRGHKLDFHTGSLAGLVAIAGIVHDKDLAVYVFANLDHAELRHAIMYKAIDLFGFNDNKRKWHKEVFDLYSGFRKNSEAAIKKKYNDRTLDTKPSLPIQLYVGTYTNPLIGTATISFKNEQLHINLNDFLSFTLSHWHFNTFISVEKTNWREQILFNFNLNQEGHVSSLNFWGHSLKKDP